MSNTVSSLHYTHMSVMKQQEKEKLAKEKEKEKTERKGQWSDGVAWSAGHHASDVHVAAGTRENGARACDCYAERAYVAASSAPLATVVLRTGYGTS